LSSPPSPQTALLYVSPGNRISCGTTTNYYSTLKRLPSRCYFFYVDHVLSPEPLCFDQLNIPNGSDMNCPEPVCSFFPQNFGQFILFNRVASIFLILLKSNVHAGLQTAKSTTNTRRFCSRTIWSLTPTVAGIFFCRIRSP
jgi:hypothetical protein